MLNETKKYDRKTKNVTEDLQVNQNITGQH